MFGRKRAGRLTCLPQTTGNGNLHRKTISSRGRNSWEAEPPVRLPFSDPTGPACQPAVLQQLGLPGSSGTGFGTGSRWTTWLETSPGTDGSSTWNVLSIPERKKFHGELDERKGGTWGNSPTSPSPASCTTPWTEIRASSSDRGFRGWGTRLNVVSPVWSGPEGFRLQHKFSRTSPGISGSGSWGPA